MTNTSVEAHTDTILNPNTAMDAVTLRVGDLETMSSYYTQALAMAPLEEKVIGGEVHRVLGRGTVPLVRLIQMSGLPGVDPRQAGLFHTAFLFETQSALAATVARAAQHPLSRYVGSADHLVSEAFYFTDPEGNGIELYTDRPRDTWVWRNGEVQMASLFLDPRDYIARHIDSQLDEADPSVPGTVGHVHLQVGNVDAARRFYVDAIGFAPAAAHPGALFASAGGYHHHVAMNTWNSAGAGPRAASLGLGDVAITVPERDDLDALVSRLRAHGIAYADEERRVVVQDPWGTQVSVALPGTTTVDTLLER